MTIHYAKGDVLEVTERPLVIAHVNNDAGGWGRGFVVNLSKKWKQPEDGYRRWAAEEANMLPLGKIMPVWVESGVYVVNMIAQHGYGSQKKQWIDYEALRQCLTVLGETKFPDCGDTDPPIVMPKIGSGLGGGDWSTIEKIIDETLGSRATVYEL